MTNDDEGDAYDNVENVKAGSGNDWGPGSDANNDLDDGVGDDTLLGGKGNDSLRGGLGNDHMNGGGSGDLLWRRRDRHRQVLRPH